MSVPPLKSLLKSHIHKNSENKETNKHDLDKN